MQIQQSLKWVAALLITAAFGASGCGTPRLGAGGLLFDDTITPVTATASQPGNRIGEACATSIFGLISRGDASVETARRNGAITLISTVDESYSNVLGIGRLCTVVRGR
jgi:hypothetical protein